MSLADAAARARHDLGRYVAMQVRWVGVDGPPGELREALVLDLRHTRRDPEGDQGVAEVWAACRPALEPAGAAALAPVDEVVAELARRAVGLEQMDAATLAETATLALTCAERVRALARALADPAE